MISLSTKFILYDMQILNKEKFRSTKNFFKEVKIKPNPITYQLARNEQHTLSKSSGFHKRYIHTFDGNMYVVEDFGKNYTHVFEGIPSKTGYKNAILSQELGKFSSSFLGTEQIYIEGIYDSNKKIFTGLKEHYIVEFTKEDNTLFIGEDNYNGTYTGMLLETNGSSILNKGIEATRETDGSISMHVLPAPEPKKESLFHKIKEWFFGLFKHKAGSIRELVATEKESTLQIMYDNNSKQTGVQSLSRSSSLLEAAINIENLGSVEDVPKTQVSTPPSHTSPSPCHKNYVVNSDLLKVISGVGLH
jgi:hypothetical protein